MHLCNRNKYCNFNDLYTCPHWATVFSIVFVHATFTASFGLLYIRFLHRYVLLPDPSIANVVTYAERFQLRAMMRACHGSVISADTDGLIVKSSPHAVASIIEEVNAYMQQLITIAHDHVPLDCA